MTFNGDPPGEPPRRLSPSELAEEVARRLKSMRSDRGSHRRGPRFDVVTASRIAMGLGVVVLVVGIVLAVGWVGRLAGFETTGAVAGETPVFGCPGEPAIGVLFSGEIVDLVGRSADGSWFAVRDGRGPGNVVYAAAGGVDPADDYEQLSPRPCDPRDADEVAGFDISMEPGTSSIVTATIATDSGTTVPGAITTTTVAGFTGGQPPRGGRPGPGVTPTTTPPSPGPLPTPAPGSSTTHPATPTQPPSTSPTTTPPAGTSPTTATTTTTTATTLPTTITTTTTASTTTTTAPTTTTTASTTTTSATSTTTSTSP